MSRTKQRKEELRQSLDDSRRQLSADFQEVGGALNVPKRFRQSFQRNATAWMVGGLAAGMFIALVSGGGRKRRRDREFKGRGIFRTALFSLTPVLTKQILRLSLPALQEVARDSLGQWLAGRFPASGPTPGPVEEPEIQPQSNPPDSPS